MRKSLLSRTGKRKGMGCLLVCGLLLCMPVCHRAASVEAGDIRAAGEETGGNDYEYIFRELPQPRYLDAAEGFAGGRGTEEDPFLISQASELVLLEKLIREGEDTFYLSAYYTLTGDIELNDTADFDQWPEEEPEYSWRPITNLGVNLHFDGGGHTIRGLYINTNNESTGVSESSYGLFGALANGSIKNLTLDQSYICVSGGEAYVGGLAGSLTGEGEITDCVSNAVIHVYDGAAGGVAGSVGGGRSANEAEEYGYTETDDERGPFSLVKDCSFGGAISQVKEGSMSFLGGIVGVSRGEIRNCVNLGTISFGALDTDTVGGIAAKADGVISGCENAGSLNCTAASGEEEETSLVRAGGIVGNLFMSATGSAKYMSRVATVENSRNTGYVSGTDSVGGIVGAAGNDRNNWCLVISGCVNSGQVVSVTGGDAGGIAGRVTCLGDPDNGDNMVIENCRNEADLNQGTVGGIIGSLFSRSGDMTIQNCGNEGDLSADEDNLYCGGIIGHWMMALLDEEDAVRVTLRDCGNEGTVAAPVGAGGIVAFAECPVKKSGNEQSFMTLSSCSNSGQVKVFQNNGFSGGICGSWGMDSVETIIENCTNTGNLMIENEKISEDELKEMEAGGFFTISRICGGVIGRVGTTMLSTDNDRPDEKNVNKEGAVLTIRECASTGSLLVNDAEEYKTKDGQRMYRNYFGGIIGNTCGEEGFSVLVEDCAYSGFERGLGNDDLPDAGDKK